MAAESVSAMESISSFGELLKYRRWRAGLTQCALGVATGYSESQIARLENGQRLPDVLAVKTYFVDALGLRLEPALAKRLVELATATHKSPAEIETGSEGAGRPAKHNLPKHNLPKHNLPLSI
ncbi:MAG: helix-turn-helix domain-containing protein, partial [Chloroflexi bacterium]|nr:helix-turn-helix domain-containing protein [Chloroflexota bacterium]